MKHKRSLSVPLIILGSLSLSSCGGQPSNDIQQQVYHSRAECEQDWNDGQSCTDNPNGEPPSDHNPHYFYGSNWYGPRYYWDHDLQRPVQLRQDGSTRVINHSRIHAGSGYSGNSSTVGKTSLGGNSRGGFGSTARGYSGGG